MPRVLSAAEVSALEKEFRLNAAAAPRDAKDLFCRLWPDVKKAIEALLKMVTNPIVKLILTIVEEMGDIAQTIFCNGSMGDAIVHSHTHEPMSSRQRPPAIKYVINWAFGTDSTGIASVRDILVPV